ncbi:hypothetical protein RHO14_10045 [Orbus wheelerorum]|uniref:hypothetical protein n=1 Tax=Orbus wheelerorum TaxID=3074111 RepID=UPI00370DAA2C
MGDYADDITQNKALMNASAVYQLGMVPTVDQMNALTSNIFWMVTKTVNVVLSKIGHVQRD